MVQLSQISQYALFRENPMSFLSPRPSSPFIIGLSIVFTQTIVVLCAPALVRAPGPFRGAHSAIRGAIFLREAHSEIREAHSCPPRGWSGAGVGVGKLRGARGSLT